MCQYAHPEVCFNHLRQRLYEEDYRRKDNEIKSHVLHYLYLRAIGQIGDAVPLVLSEDEVDVLHRCFLCLWWKTPFKRWANIKVRLKVDEID